MGGLITSRFAGMGRGMRASGGDILQNPDFYTDPHAIALYRYEKNHLTRDSTGHGNSLTGVPTEEGSNFREGRGAAHFENSLNQYQLQGDADLSTGYPGKLGDAVKQITVCFWVYHHVLTGGTYYAYYWKGHYAASPNGTICWFLAQLGTIFRFGISADGSSYNQYTIDPGMVVNRWYHCAMTYNGVTKALHLRVWGQTEQTVTDQWSVTAEAPLIANGPVLIGAGDYSGVPAIYLDGVLDELVVFNTILTSAQIDKVRNGTYDL
jgi:hypothetical protein